MSSAPSRIYLQVGDDAEPPINYSESTWCADRINDSDVEYVRADLATSSVERTRQGAAPLSGAQQASALAEARDAILNERGPLEGMGLTGEQINAVLTILDDAASVTTPQPEAAPEPADIPVEREHEASADCWCEPAVDYIDPITDAKVYVHRRAQ